MSFREYELLHANRENARSLHHLGRLLYKCAGYNWLKRIGLRLFCSCPAPTYDHAIAYFLEVEIMMPLLWMDNQLWLAKAYLAKGDKKCAIEYLNRAVSIEPLKLVDLEALAEVKKLLRKYSK